MSTGEWITVACVAFFGALLIGSGVAASYVQVTFGALMNYGF